MLPQREYSGGIGVRLIQPPLAYIKKSSEGFTEGFMFAVSKGGGFLSSAVGVVTSPCVCATGLVGGGGFFSDGILPTFCTFGGGVAVARGGDFCGSVWARNDNAQSRPTIVKRICLIICGTEQ